MADWRCVQSDSSSEEEQSDTDPEDSRDETDGVGGSIAHWFHDMGSWLKRSTAQFKETLVERSRSGAFTAMQGVLDVFASLPYHEDGGAYPVEALTGGPKPGDKVLVIGAGPAGVHMAMKLQRLGHEVTIIDKNTVGGKARSRHYRDAIHEMGACYLSPDYELVVQLLQEFQLSEQYLLKNRTIRTDDASDKGDKKLRDWFYAAAKAAKGEPDASNSHIAYQIFSDAFNYVSHHRRLLKNYTETGFLPPRPSQEHLDELQMPMNEFFEKHQIQTMKPIIKLAYTAMGYGFVEEEPILYGMLWVTPTLINGLIETLKVRKNLSRKRLRKADGTPKAATVLKNGFQTLFTAIIAQCLERSGKDGYQPFTLVENCQITDLKRDDDGVRIEYHREYMDDQGALQTEASVSGRFDFTVVAVPLPQIRHQLDMRDDETKVFSSLHESTFITTLADYTPAKTGDEASLEYWFDNMELDREYTVWCARDTHQLMKENNETVVLDPPEVGTVVTYQFTSHSVEDDRRLSQAELEDKIEDERLLCEDKLKRVLEQTGRTVRRAEHHRMRYFPRHTGEAISEGVLWNIMEMQGKYRTWFLGSQVCFEACNAIMGYNEQLLKVWKRQQEQAGHGAESAV